MRVAPKASSLFLLCVVLAPSQAHVGPKELKPCTTAESIYAGDGLTSLKSWADVHRAYTRFAQCDQGYVAEGYSDAVARFLSEKWGSTGELNRLCSRDRGFEKFVLRHVDELMTPQQARMIRENANSHCPKDASRLCKGIVRRIDATPTAPNDQH